MTKTMKRIKEHTHIKQEKTFKLIAHTQIEQLNIKRVRLNTSIIVIKKRQTLIIKYKTSTQPHTTQ